LTNERGYSAPNLSIGCKESDSDVEWTIHCDCSGVELSGGVACLIGRGMRCGDDN
jgi:hypothetical protein